MTYKDPADLRRLLQREGRLQPVEAEELEDDQDWRHRPVSSSGHHERRMICAAALPHGAGPHSPALGLQGRIGVSVYPQKCVFCGSQTPAVRVSGVDVYCCTRTDPCVCVCVCVCVFLSVHFFFKRRLLASDMLCLV